MRRYISELNFEAREAQPFALILYGNSMSFLNFYQGFRRIIRGGKINFPSTKAI